eukprot:TRINITY_DN16809_c0_g2_i1.p1 TRINITY_DN16809_c0_g2~~TRINITY_DN16809_c0_g2_i1.p1  ORF type:complete len:544 (+),score=109.38 TRINITY_DN16809_c0_g2_i1:83-1714(+)
MTHASGRMGAASDVRVAAARNLLASLAKDVSGEAERAHLEELEAMFDAGPYGMVRRLLTSLAGGARGDVERPHFLALLELFDAGPCGGGCGGGSGVGPGGSNAGCSSGRGRNYSVGHTEAPVPLVGGNCPTAVVAANCGVGSGATHPQEIVKCEFAATREAALQGVSGAVAAAAEETSTGTVAGVVKRRRISGGAAAAPLSPTSGSAAAAAPAARTVKINPSSGNERLAEIFEEMGAIQKLKRDRFRSRAYEKAAQALRNHPVAILSGPQAKAIEGIGDGMSRRIDIVLETGELQELHDLRRDHDVVALRELRSVHGIGPVRAAELIEKDIRSLAELRAAVSGGAVRLDTVQTIGLRYAEEFSKKIPRTEMVDHEALLLRIGSEKHPHLRMLVCGSYRRGKAESGDIDLLITAPEFTSLKREANFGGKLLHGLVQSLREVGYITDDLTSGATKYMGVCRLPGSALHRRIDIRCVPSDQYHYGTLYFTGSSSLSVRLRMKAIELGMTLNEYCLEIHATGEQVKVSCERDIFGALEVDYLEPTHR